jgi:protein-S-isoprenylcysteine O-methyltransferase Ste14
MWPNQIAVANAGERLQFRGSPPLARRARAGSLDLMATTRTPQKLWFAGKVFLTVLLIAVAFGVVIPNCVVPATPSHPAHVAWSGLIGAFIVSCGVVYCVWFWRCRND